MSTAPPQDRTIPIEDLAEVVRTEDAVEAACADDLAFVEERLARGMSVLVECDKELALYLYLSVRSRLKRRKHPHKLVVIDGRPPVTEEGEDAGPPSSTLSRMLHQLTDAIRGSVHRSILVLQHLDVLTTTHTALTMEAREVILLLHENPDVVLLAFKDPSFPIPQVIEQVFSARREIVGIPRDALPKLITRREAQCIHADRFDPYGLYRYVSGLNPVRCRRVFEALGLRRIALPGRPPNPAVYQEIRNETAGGDMELPSVDLTGDIAGYDLVKERLSDELITLIQRWDASSAPEQMATIESLLPRGVIFHGPPGTGKTLFAKAIATAINATVLIVSGPELKSKWVGESEANLRAVFRKARRAAPSVIVFDELDAFASARGTYSGSGVEHSMVNQLLTEMDGFRSNEMVFVVGTTNFLESVDAALLRPGRFEFLIEVPAPDETDREAIARLYDAKFGLKLPDAAISHIVRRTGAAADPQTGQPFTGDHLNALFRALMRLKLRTDRSEFTLGDIDQALQRRTHREIVLSDAEERVIAVHEAGHALVAMLLPEATPPERIAIVQDLQGALGYVLRAARTRPYALTGSEMRADICVGLGGTVAERMVFGEASVGAFSDLQNCGRLARAMVAEFGMDPDVGPHVQLVDASGRPEPMHDRHSEAIDRAVERILSEEMERATTLLSDNEALHSALVQLLLEHKVLTGEQITTFRQEGT
ncbi:MAG: AAA family ATPase [Myxococcales bacterium]|nr:AAA family ATPase [Myxococcales bacterium]